MIEPVRRGIGHGGRVKIALDIAGSKKKRGDGLALKCLLYRCLEDLVQTRVVIVDSRTVADNSLDLRRVELPTHPSRLFIVNHAPAIAWRRSRTCDRFDKFRAE